MNTTDITVDSSFYADIIRPDLITYLEMARTAISMMPDELADQMDLSYDEIFRLSLNLNAFMNNDE